MSFRFEIDYLKDLEPVLVWLEAAGLPDALRDIEHCKTSGATGGEILSCVCASLRKARREGIDSTAKRAIDEYLEKAGRNY
jgi:hypothetical protein